MKYIKLDSLLKMANSISEVKVTTDSQNSQNIHHMLIKWSSNGIQMPAHTKQLLQNHRYIFTHVAHDACLLKDIKENKDSLFHFSGHLEHFAECALKVNNATLLGVWKLVVLLGHCRAKGASGRVVDKLF